MCKTWTTVDGSRRECCRGISKQMRNIRVIFDQHLNFKSHIKAIVRVLTSNYTRFRIFLEISQKTSRNSNPCFCETKDWIMPKALLYGLPKCLYQIMQCESFTDGGRSREFKRVCYFGGWSLKRKDNEARTQIDDIDPFLCTHIIYAFATINTADSKLQVDIYP